MHVPGAAHVFSHVDWAALKVRFAHRQCLAVVFKSESLPKAQAFELAVIDGVEIFHQKIVVFDFLIFFPKFTGL